MNKVLVTGGNGSLAKSLYNLVRNNTDKYIFLDIDMLDITSKKSINDIFKKHSFNFVLHYAAYTNVDEAENNKIISKQVNVTGTKFLTEYTVKYNIPILYISTDYIFDGSLPVSKSYSERSKSNPINYYGKTKLMGEKIIKENKKHYIVRTEWLYGNYGNNFVKTMIKLLKSNDVISVVNDQIGSLTFADTLNKIILELIKTKKYGIYNITNKGFGTRYDIVRFISDTLKLNSCDIVPVNSNEIITPAKRPLNSRLNLYKIEKLLNINIPDWKQDLKKYLGF